MSISKFILNLFITYTDIHISFLITSSTWHNIGDIKFLIYTTLLSLDKIIFFLRKLHYFQYPLLIRTNNISIIKSFSNINPMQITSTHKHGQFTGFLYQGGWMPKYIIGKISISVRMPSNYVIWSNYIIPDYWSSFTCQKGKKKNYNISFK